MCLRKMKKEKMKEQKVKTAMSISILSKALSRNSNYLMINASTFALN